MKHLIKKDLLRLLFYLLPFFMILSFFFLIEGDILTDKSPYIWIFYMFILIAGAIFTMEKNEEKHKGYHFLARLPVTDREIVMAKFILLLVVVMVLMACNLVLSFTDLVPAKFSRIVQLAMFIFGWIYLITIGLIYIIIFKKGCTKAMTIVWITFIGGLFTFLFLMSSVLKVFNFSFSRITNVAMNMNPIYWVVISLVSLFVYYLLMKTAIRVKTKARLNEAY